MGVSEIKVISKRTVKRKQRGLREREREGGRKRESERKRYVCVREGRSIYTME